MSIKYSLCPAVKNFDQNRLLKVIFDTYSKDVYEIDLNQGVRIFVNGNLYIYSEIPVYFPYNCLKKVFWLSPSVFKYHEDKMLVLKILRKRFFRASFDVLCKDGVIKINLHHQVTAACEHFYVEYKGMQIDCRSDKEYFDISLTFSCVFFMYMDALFT